MNGYNFTEAIRRTLDGARAESMRLQHEYLGTEHLLLSLCRDDEGVAAAVLTNLSAARSALIAGVEAIVKRGRAPLPADTPIAFTSRAKKVLELAMSEAREMRHDHVGTEHLLIGLVHEGKGIAAQVLLANGVTLDDVRNETRRLLGVPPAADAAPSEALIESLDPWRRSPTISIHVELRDGVNAPRRHTFDSARAAIHFLQAVRLARRE